MERRVSEIVSGKASPQAGLDNLALDLQHILGGKAQLRYPVKTGPVSVRLTSLPDFVHARFGT